MEKALIERGHARTAKAYIVYRYEHALKRSGPGEPDLLGGEHPLPQALGGALLGHRPRVRHASRELAGIVARGRLRRARRGLRTRSTRRSSTPRRRRSSSGGTSCGSVIIAGPSSSGKTTTTLKIREKLAAAGIAHGPPDRGQLLLRPRRAPEGRRGRLRFRDPAGPGPGADQRAPARPCSDGRTVAGAALRLHARGSARASRAAFRLAKDEVLLIDSLHGLFPEMTASIAEEREVPPVHRDALAGPRPATGRYIRWADVRMLRRIVRDMQFRSYSPRADHPALAPRAPLRAALHRARSCSGPTPSSTASSPTSCRS